MMNTKTSTLGNGPKAIGRKKSSLRHGLSATCALLPSENERVFLEYRDGLTASLKPVGSMEEELVERVASSMWRLRRVGLLEGEILMELSTKAESARLEKRIEWISKQISGDMNMWQQESRNPSAYKERAQLFEEGRELYRREGKPSFGEGLLMADTDRSFGLLRRYESRLERSVYLALRQLSELQAVRKAEEREMARVHRLPQKVTLVTGGELKECEWTPAE